MLVLARIALRNLLLAPRRSGLLGAAIALVTGLLVVLLAVSAGIEDNLVRSATQLSAGHVNVGGFHKTTPTDAAPLITNAAVVRTLVEEQTPGLDYLVDRHRGWGKIISDSGTVQSGLTGITVADEARFLEALVMADGDARKLEDPGGIVVFEEQARRLRVDVGDTVTVQTETQGGWTNTMDATVVGVARDLGMLSGWSCFLSKADVIELYQLNADTTGAIWVYLDDIDTAPEVMKHLASVFEEAGYAVMDHQAAPFFFKFETVGGEDWTGQKLDLTIWRDEVSFLTWVLTAFDTVTWFLVLVLVNIIMVGIVNALWSSVRERTTEIGTMRAIGMSRLRVLLLVLLEALILGALATTVGAIVGAALAVGVDAADIAVPVDAMRSILLADTLTLSVRAPALVTAVVALTVFTGLAAVLPALRAARLPPVTAIHHVE